MGSREPVVRVQPAWPDPRAVLRVIRGAGPYRPLARYAASEAEQRASGGAGGVFVPPWFRADVALEGQVLVSGGEVLLENAAFVDAAARVFGGERVVDPTTVYVNVMTPCAYPFIAHLDVPVFRGRSRRNTPTWLLKVMHASGLFEAERIDLATGVSWFYAGPGGHFHYWPDGPDDDPSVERAPFDNVADNEHVYHGVGPVGDVHDPSPDDLTLDAELRHGRPAGSSPTVDGSPSSTRTGWCGSRHRGRPRCSPTPTSGSGSDRPPGPCRSTRSSTGSVGTSGNAHRRSHSRTRTG